MPKYSVAAVLLTSRHTWLRPPRLKRLLSHSMPKYSVAAVDDASRSFLRPIQHNILPNLDRHVGIRRIFSICQVVSVCFSNCFLFICISLLYHFFLLPLPYFRRKTTRKSHITGRVEDKKTGTLRTFLKDVFVTFLQRKTTRKMRITGLLKT